MRQEAIRSEETEEENRLRLQEQAVRQANLRALETTEERMERVMSDRVRHQLNIANEN